MESKNLIMMNSITSVMRAKEIIAKKGLRSQIVRTPKSLAKNGCGYSLYVPFEISKAQEIIRASGISFTVPTRERERK
ncbi:MAG: DUF3343 domain-containing protein [Clostridia bacterium]|nr:DUF3343 domain-containing protein [Clostridia bacterium]